MQDDEGEGQRGRTMEKGEGSVIREGPLNIVYGRGEGHKREAATEIELSEVEGGDAVAGREGEMAVDPFTDEASERMDDVELGERVESDLLKIDLDDVLNRDEARTSHT
jgi:hypothetical protein